jgi:hypothetical protein
MKFIKILGCLLFLLSELTFASKALYSITPIGTSIVPVPPNFKASVNYRVLNQTQQTQTLSFQESFGLTQLVQAGSCDNPFTLGPNESCVLSLWVDGNDIVSATTLQGPEICKLNSRFFCSLPDAEHLIKTHVLNYDFVLVANPSSNGGLSDGTLSYCEVGSSGSLENCQNFSNSNLITPGGVAATPRGYVYTANQNSDNIAVCSLDTNIAAMTCVTDDGGGSVFNFPVTAYVNNNYFYTLNANSNEVIKCDIDANTGTFVSSSCASTGDGFSKPVGSMVIANGYAYIANFIGNNISICPVSATDGTFISPCSTFSNGGLLTQPSGVAVSGAYAYIVQDSSDLLACEIASDGSLSNCVSNNLLPNIGHFGINILSGYAYVNSGNEVFKCTLGNKGTVTDCASTGSGFEAPGGNISFVTI